MATTPSHAPLRTLYPNEGSAAKPVFVTISDKSLAALTKAGGIGGGGSGDSGAKSWAAQQVDSMKTMIKHLAGLGAITMLLNKMAANSQVLNAYQSAMGKVFGGVMDMLMLPFLPLLNLIMLFLGKLMVWLVTSGTLAKIQKVMEQVAKYIESIAKFFYNLFRLIIKGEWSEAAKYIVQGFKDAFKDMFSGDKTKLIAGLLLPSIALGMGGFMLGGPSMAMKGAMLPIKLLTSLLTGTAGLGIKGIGAIFSRGGGTPPIVPPGGGGMGSGGVGMSRFAKAGGYAIAGEIASLGIDYMAEKMGYGGTKGASALSYAAKGAGFGAAIGTLIAPGAGTAIGAGLGALAGGIYGYTKAQGQGGGSGQEAKGGDVINSHNKNSNNVINLNITMGASANSSQAVNEALKAAEARSGYQLKTGAGSLSGYPLQSKNSLSWKQAAVLSTGIPGVPLAAKAVGFI